MDWLFLLRSVTNQAAAVVFILLVGFIVGRILGRLVFRILHEFNVDSFVRKGGSVEKGVSQVFEYTVYIITVCIGLDTLGILGYVLVVSVALAVLVLVVSALLGFRDFIPNFFCGLWLARHYSISVGDNVRFGDVKGRVVKSSLLRVDIQDKYGDIISVPNLLVLRKRFRS